MFLGRWPSTSPRASEPIARHPVHNRRLDKQKPILHLQEYSTDQPCDVHSEVRAAVAKLEAAKEIEDAMSYMEPPRLWQPIQQCLGFVHLNATRDAAAAERAYREDLVELPRNGWSLLGLGQALTAQGSPDGQAIIADKFAAAYADADVTIDSSCLAFSKF